MEQVNPFAIVRWQDQQDQEETGTPFKRFMSALLSRQAQKATTMAGSAEWGNMPIEEVVAYGLWAVMLRVSEIYHLSMETEEQIINVVAPRVDRLLNAGLTLAYQTGDQAADAFTSHMSYALADAMQELPVGQQTSFQDLVQLPAAQFFAGLVKRMLDLMRKVERLVDQVHESNTMTDPDDLNRSSITYVDDSGTAIFERMVDILNSGASHWAGTTKEIDMESCKVYDLVSVAIEQLESTLNKLRIMHRIPLKLSGVPEEALPRIASIERCWLNTQLVLAAIDAPDRDYVEMAEFEAGIKAMKAMDGKQLAGKFAKRMRARGVFPKSETERLLISLALGRVPELRRRLAMIDAFNVIDFFINVQVNKLKITRRNALQIAGGDFMVEEAFPLDASSAAEVSEKLARQISWRRVDLKTFRSFVDQGVLTNEYLIEGLAKMNAKLRESALQILLEERDVDGALLGPLLAGGSIKLTLPLLGHYLDRAPADKLLEHFKSFLLALLERTGGERFDASLVQRLIRNTLRLAVGEARKLFARPELREGIRHLITEELADPYDQRGNSISNEELRKFIDHIGRETFHRYVLTSEVVMREDIYGGGRWLDQDEEMRKIRIAPWAELATAKYPHIIVPLPGVLRAKKEEVQKILDALGEDEVYRWYYAAHKDVAKRLAAFRKARAAYYQRWEKKPKTTARRRKP